MTFGRTNSPTLLGMLNAFDSTWRFGGNPADVLGDQRAEAADAADHRAALHGVGQHTGALDGGRGWFQSLHQLRGDNDSEHSYHHYNDATVSTGSGNGRQSRNIHHLCHFPGIGRRVFVTPGASIRTAARCMDKPLWRNASCSSSSCSSVRRLPTSSSRAIGMRGRAMTHPNGPHLLCVEQPVREQEPDRPALAHRTPAVTPREAQRADPPGWPVERPGNWPSP